MPVESSSAPNIGPHSRPLVAAGFTCLQVGVQMNQNGSCEVKLHLTRVGEARHLADFRKCQWDWFQSAVLPGLRTFANALGLELVLRKKQAKPLSSLARS